MPTYYARGVTASLATCDLHCTLTRDVKLTMGAECRKENQRVQQVFSNAQKLCERPVGADGSTHGILQFIGEGEDLPLYVAEAGKNVGQWADEKDEDDEMDWAPSETPKQSALLGMSDDSSLTSLGETPTSTYYGAFESTSQAVSLAVQSGPFDMARSLTDRLTSLASNNPVEEALVLDIDLSHSSFLPCKPTDKRAGINDCKDLKVEVFMNGELVEVKYVPARNAKTGSLKQSLRCTGTRVHRQVEKPWVYIPTASSDAPSQSGTARWRAVSGALAREVANRGHNKFGNKSPSAEFLAALSTLELAPRFKSHHRLAVIDIVITAGRGYKYGPETSYIINPTRFDDHDYSVFLLNANLKVEARNSHDVRPNFHSIGLAHSTLEGYIQQSSPEVPLRQARMAHLGSPSPPRKSVRDLEKELDLGKSASKVLFASYERTSGASGRGSRTLMQRLGDISKMSPVNQAKEMTRLKDDLSNKGSVGRIKKKMKLDHTVDPQSTASPPPPPKMNLDDMIDPRLAPPSVLLPPKLMSHDDPFVTSRQPTLELEQIMLANEDPFRLTVASVTGDGETMSPTHMFKDWSLHVSAPSVPNNTPSVTLASTAAHGVTITQDRIDMALGAGAASRGHLLNRMAGSTPTGTPRKKTQASSLANSPTCTPVKSQSRPGPPKTPTPQRSRSVLDPQGSPIRTIRTPGRTNRGDKTPTPGRSGAGANRSATKWIPGEPDWTDGIQKFKASSACDGSCVTYTEDKDAQRQIGKARAGTFKEETVLVGMRFIVV